MAGGQMYYKTSVNVGPATNLGALRSLLDAPSRTPSNSRTVNTAAQFAGKAQRLGDWGHMSTQARQANNQQLMSSQAKRSELTMSGLQNQQQIFSDFNDRQRAQIDLEAQVSSSNIGYQYGLAASLARRAANMRRGNP
jgi:hypothetical protein